MAAFQTDVRLSRLNQISSLRVFNDNVTEVVPGKEYSVSFSSASGLNLKLIIKLTDKFPTEKPQIEIFPVVLHPWIHATSGRVDSPGLRNFSQHSDLGMVILALRRELEKANLRLQQLPSSQGLQLQQLPASSGFQLQSQRIPTSPSSSVSSAGPQNPTSTSATDPIRSQLSDLSIDDLKGILNDDDHFEKFILETETELALFGSLDDSLESLREELKKKALENQELQSQIESSRNQIICKYEEFHKRKSELLSTVERLKELNARVEPNLLIERLLGLSVECDEESEEIAENFLQTNIQIEQFIPQYIQRRGDGYLKKVKADKLKKQIKKKQ